MPRIHDRVLLLLGIMSSLALGFSGFLGMAPNRLARGVDLSIWDLSPAWGAAIAAQLLAFFLLALVKGRSQVSQIQAFNDPSFFETPQSKPRPPGLMRLLRMGGLKTWHPLAFILRSERSERPEGRGQSIGQRSNAILIFAAILFYACLLAAGILARTLASPAMPAMRLSLGAGFWIPLACALFACLDALQRQKAGIAMRGLCFALLFLPFFFFARAGLFDALSLAKEFETHRAAFVQALCDHLLLVSLALVIALSTAIPIILAMRWSARLQKPVYASLGAIQAIPSIALFGLLIAPLSALVLHMPVLAQFGIGGTGRAPAIIALVLYALLPLVRNGMTGLSAVSPDVKDAAIGLGFTASKRILKIDLPLAWPALLSGLRVVTVQAIGLASVAALIGAGGLGTFVFQGIGQYALDLVLVGAIPIILLALGADFGFQLLLSIARERA